MDVNLLVDYQWPAVLQHMASLIDGLGSPAALCELLQGLQPGSVLHPTTGLYRELTTLLAPALLSGTSDADTSTKIPALCRSATCLVQDTCA